MRKPSVAVAIASLYLLAYYILFHYVNDYRYVVWMFMGFFGYLVNLKVRNELRKLSPYIIGAIGVLLVLRGLNLGIPFISPVMESAPAAALECH